MRCSWSTELKKEKKQKNYTVRETRWTEDDSLVTAVAKHVPGSMRWTGERYRSQIPHARYPRAGTLAFLSAAIFNRGAEEPRTDKIRPINPFGPTSLCAETWKANSFSTFERAFYRGAHLPLVKWHLWNRRAHFHRSEREPQERKVVDVDIRPTRFRASIRYGSTSWR